MYDFEVGDLVEVKKDKELSPSLRFFHNKKGMIVEKQSEGHSGLCGIFIEWRILFSNQKSAIFKDYELNLIARANKKND